ncbi:hypothetical protein POI8812_01977 [Pontivivens insulae]|uniref:Uncharacterized protein n=1 Tax=Pontivivens insulae TaxID=1639689 RepID=A0A2R8ABS2_9RHOB|nr:hypothetical protein DFR53_3195 [Pontivivens insulae]SPF29661.1 hypothetical protein POI8812_01977 [Pontivivens insulae]
MGIHYASETNRGRAQRTTGKFTQRQLNVSTFKFALQFPEDTVPTHTA